MKKLQIFAAAAALLAMTIGASSCSKDDDVTVEPAGFYSIEAEAASLVDAAGDDYDDEDVSTFVEKDVVEALNNSYKGIDTVYRTQTQAVDLFNAKVQDVLNKYKAGAAQLKDATLKLRLLMSDGNGVMRESNLTLTATSCVNDGDAISYNPNDVYTVEAYKIESSDIDYFYFETPETDENGKVVMVLDSMPSFASSELADTLEIAMAEFNAKLDKTMTKEQAIAAFQAQLKPVADVAAYVMNNQLQTLKNMQAEWEAEGNGNKLIIPENPVLKTNMVLNYGTGVVVDRAVINTTKAGSEIIKDQN